MLMMLTVVPLVKQFFKKVVFQAIREKETGQTCLIGFRNESPIQESFRNDFCFSRRQVEQDSRQKGGELLKRFQFKPL